MNVYTETILLIFSDSARAGRPEVNVFDLMYETGLTYPHLKERLDYLVEQNEIEQIDIKTYRFTGDICREPNVPFDEPVLKVDENRTEAERLSGRKKADPLATRQAQLKEQRREIMELIREREQKETEEKQIEIISLSPEYEDEIRLTELIVSLMRRTKSGQPHPAHPSWGEEEEFLYFCAEKMIRLVSDGAKPLRQNAVKEAAELMRKAKNSYDSRLAETYERIIFELRRMSNYYYLKIRERRV